MNYEQAFAIAEHAHRFQVRKWSGKPYITHPIAVADAFDDVNYRIVAVLHDTIEDTSLTFKDLAEKGVQGDLLYVIDILTHKETQSYCDYILRIKDVTMARLIKIEDIKHNMSDLKFGCLYDKYMLALYILN